MTPQLEPTGPSLSQRVAAEFIGTAFLLAAVVGSGIMAERLSTDPGLQLLQNAIATAAVLTALILALQKVSGAHFNPAVTLGFRLLGSVTNTETASYVAAQVTGGALGVVLANAMFDLSPVAVATTERAGTHLILAEGVATLGLLLVIFGPVLTDRAYAVAFAVGGYIAGAYYFTSSTSFANPAVTMARTLTDTYAGIAPASVPGFLVAQLLAAGVAAFIAAKVLVAVPAERAGV